MTPTVAHRQKLPRVTLSTQISALLRDEILSGVFEPGAQLNEMQIALGFGVSRGPLREAMQRLIQEGLLRSEPNRGVFVPELCEEELRDVFFLRTTLETAAVRRILSRSNRKEVSRELTRIAGRMQRALSAEKWREGSELDFAFHRALVDAAGSERLSRSYATVQAETRLCLHNLMGGYRNSKALADEHFHLAKLISDGDLEEILLALTEHLQDPTTAFRKARADSGTAAQSRRRSTKA